MTDKYGILRENRSLKKLYKFSLIMFSFMVIIRLWGDNGQTLLENANICVINANALGCEVLKSLVLPGIGAFTIVDGSNVTEDDLGNK